MIKNAEATNSLSETELNILNSYLPKQMGIDEVKQVIIDFVVNNGISSPKEMGKVMSYLKSGYDGQYDGKMASTIIKEILS
jgi:uncharacterized protein YqeY